MWRQTKERGWFQLFFHIGIASFWQGVIVAQSHVISCQRIHDNTVTRFELDCGNSKLSGGYVLMMDDAKMWE
jgi:hypothetical protein